MRIVAFTALKFVIGFGVGIFFSKDIVLASTGQVALYTGLAIIAAGLGIGSAILRNEGSDNQWLWRLELLGAVIGGFLLGIVVMSFF